MILTATATVSSSPSASASVSTGSGNVTHVWTDFDGFWASDDSTRQPNAPHHLLAFQVGAAVYSTGVDDGELTAQGITSFTPGDWKALPVAGMPTTNSTNYIVIRGGQEQSSGFVGELSSDDISVLCIIDEARHLVCLAPPRTQRPEQYSVTSLRDLTRVSGNYLGACGLEPDGAVRCFAWDGSTREDIRRFTPPEGLALQLVRLDLEFGCGIDLAGEVRCWGRAGRVAEAPSGPFVDLAMGLGTACALRTDGTVVCWGPGSGPPQPPRGARFTSITVNPWTGFACGATTRGEAVCWGAGAYDGLQRTLSTW